MKIGKNIFLNRLAKKVRDQLDEFFIRRKVLTFTYAGGDDETTIVLAPINNIPNLTNLLYAGDEILLDDGTDNAIFIDIKSVVNQTTLKVEGDVSNINAGAYLNRYDTEPFLLDALKTYSKFRPFFKGSELTSVANGKCALPDDYYSNFSYINFINYPVTTDDKLCSSDYKVDMDTDGEMKIFFSIFNTADVKFVYAIPLEFVEANNETGKPKVDIDKIDVDCICDIAASYYCLTKAARFGDSKSATQSADAVNYLDKVNLFIKLSNEFLTKASAWLNIDINELKKGQAVGMPGAYMQEFDSNFLRGGDLLTH